MRVMVMARGSLVDWARWTSPRLLGASAVAGLPLAHRTRSERQLGRCPDAGRDAGLEQGGEARLQVRRLERGQADEGAEANLLRVVFEPGVGQRRGDLREHADGVAVADA